MSRFGVDRERSAGRRAALDAYSTESVASASDGLVCRFAAPCTTSAARDGLEFYGGQLGHVGACYDLNGNGLSLRLLVVGQEFGRKPDSIPIGGRAVGAGDVVTVDERRRDLVGWRGGQSFNERNAHMRGTSLAVRTVFEAVLGYDSPGLSTDKPGEVFSATSGEPFHMFDGFAFTNMLLCSATRPKSTTGRPTVDMRRNCRVHLAATIEVLEPTIVLVQKAPSAALSSSWLAPLVGTRHAVGSTPNTWRTTIAGLPCILCAVNHPSAGNASVGWQWPSFPYWTTVVRPALLDAVRALDD